jgi:hypothetical protein
MRSTFQLGPLAIPRIVEIRSNQSLFQRPARITALLAILFTLSSFDFAYTQAQLIRGNFLEANLFAAGFVSAGAMQAAAYKAVLLGIGVVLLYRLRKHWLAEASAWGLVACHVGLMVRWQVYLQYALICADDPFTDSPPLIY